MDDATAAPKAKPKRILHATKVGPLDMLLALRRLSQGESVVGVSRDIGINDHTLRRWWAEHNSDVGKLQDMLEDLNRGDAYKATDEMARHVAECDAAYARIEAAITHERAKLRSKRMTWGRNPMLEKAGKLIASLITRR